METIVSSFKIAIDAIFTNKTRSFLTMLGIIIGVGSVILLTSIGNGIQSYITDQFDALGANSISILPGDIFGEGGGFSQDSQVSAFSNNKLRLRDVQALEKLRAHIATVTPIYQNVASVSYGSVNKKLSIIGTTPSYTEATNTKLTKGRFFNQDEYQGAKRIAIIGPETAKKLFGAVDPIGKRIKLASQTFQVIGVTEAKGGGFGGPQFDTYVFIPITIAFRIFDAQAISEINVQATNKDVIPEAIADIKKELGKRLKSDEFSVFDQKEILKTINQILGVLTVGLGGIAAISLVVGGIGILNIMLVSVIERTREIGLRKALGATPNIILIQFLIEAATLSVMGGLIGTALAYLLTLLIRQAIPAVVTIESVAVAFGVSALIGIIFGVIPARRAARLSPIEALRYE